MLIVSNYHYIREDFRAAYPSIFGLTPTEFRSQLEELSRHGTFVSQQDLLKLRKRPLDKNYILITFDDGLKEQYDLAKPIMDEMGIPFVFFINTANFQERKVSLVHKIHLLRSRISSDAILNELPGATLSPAEKNKALVHYNYDEPGTAILKYFLNFKMNHEELKGFIGPIFNEIFDERKIASELYFDDSMLQELSRQKSLGSHSHQHVPLGQLSSDQLRIELQSTQEYFRDNFGKPAQAISYPYGSRESCSGISIEVEKHGFNLGFSMERAVNYSLEEDSLLLSRFDCNDMPLGKNDLFRSDNLFTNPPLRNWYKNESSFTD